jgi:hypothetical protein
MKRYFNRNISVGDKEVTRTIIEQKGVATAAINGTRHEVTPVGNPLDTQTKWTVKRAAQA